MEPLVKLFNDLESGWGAFRNNQEDEKFAAAEFSKLLPKTLQFNLDVSQPS